MPAALVMYNKHQDPLISQMTAINENMAISQPVWHIALLLFYKRGLCTCRHLLVVAGTCNTLRLMDLERVPYPHSRCMNLDGSPSRLALHEPSAMLAVICSRVSCKYAAPEAMCTSTLCAAQDELQCIRATSGGSHSPLRPIHAWIWFEVMCRTCPCAHIISPPGHVPWFPCLVYSAACLHWQSAHFRAASGTHTASKFWNLTT